MFYMALTHDLNSEKPFIKTVFPITIPLYTRTIPTQLSLCIPASIIYTLVQNPSTLIIPMDVIMKRINPIINVLHLTNAKYIIDNNSNLFALEPNDYIDLYDFIQLEFSKIAENVSVPKFNNAINTFNLNIHFSQNIILKMLEIIKQRKAINIYMLVNFIFSQNNIGDLIFDINMIDIDLFAKIPIERPPTPIDN